MRHPLLVIAVAVSLGLPTLAGAQDPRDLAVKTFKLQNLRPEDAAKLLGPYVNSPGGGVFEAGSIGAITVRETPTIIALVDSILRVHDRPRAIVSLRFQLIAALDSTRRDPAIADIETELRKLFKFNGYALIGEGTATTEEMNEFTMTLSARAATLAKGSPDTPAFDEPYVIKGWVERVEGTGADRTVRLNLSLQDARRGRDATDLLRTGLTMPMGQGVILGSATPPNRLGSRVALILVVQPELAATNRR
jgi:hypothetical protein